MKGGRRETNGTRSSAGGTRRGVVFNDRRGSRGDVTTWGQSPCLDHRWRWGWGGRMGIRVVRGDHAWENWSNGGCGCELSWRGLGCGRSRSMRNRQRSTVNSRRSMLRIAWFGITWW